MKENPFSWWTGSAADGARAMYEDRPDGQRADGRARQLLVALARQFKTRFATQSAQLLDELIAILQPSSGSVEAAAARAVDAVAKEGVKAARRVRGAARLAKRDAERQPAIFDARTRRRLIDDARSKSDPGLGQRAILVEHGGKPFLVFIESQSVFKAVVIPRKRPMVFWATGEESEAVRAALAEEGKALAESAPRKLVKDGRDGD
jgi:hypothetical protein